LVATQPIHVPGSKTVHRLSLHPAHIEKRLEDQEHSSHACLEQQKRESNLCIAKLEQDLAQYHTREGAIKAVFFREFENQKELYLEDRLLKIKAEVLTKKAQRLDDKAIHPKKKRMKTAKRAQKAQRDKLELEEALALSHSDANITSEPEESCHPSYNILMHRS
jgi:hypothetical protein